MEKNSCCNSAPKRSQIKGKEKCCCSEGNVKLSYKSITQFDRKDRWITGEILTSVGIVPRISTYISFEDAIGAWKVRWGINRMNYKIHPGIYAIGTPDKESPVLVTCNYKLTFDMLRGELPGMDAWILVLDTKGINVWCAAGKGTFGTEELVKRIALTKLSEIVSHKTLILPQLGASGISAHEVQKESGFKVIYGTVRASDLKEFLNNDMKATAEMRKVRFTIVDRLVLTPIELVGTLKISMILFGVLFIFNLFAINKFGFIDFYGYIGALFVGCFLVPVLLPWIPGKAFALKGWILGIIWAALVNILNGWPLSPTYGLGRAIAYMFILPAISGYYAMNFTGSSTYTSFSGVIKEMKAAVPAIIISLSLGCILIVLSTFILGF